MLADSEPEMPVAAVVNWFGITDVNDLIEGKNAKTYAVQWRGSVHDREAVAKRVSPMTYVRAGLPRRDDFTDSSLVRALVPEAEERRDRRALRLFAEDKVDGGPLGREEQQWRNAVDSERQLLRATL